MIRQGYQLRVRGGGGLLVAASLLAAALAGAQPAPPTRATPDQPSTSTWVAEPKSDAKALLQDLYRQVYELQLQIARVDSEADRDRLELERSILLDRIESVRDRVEALGAGDEENLAESDSLGLGVIVGELERLGVNTDWESIGKIFEGNTQNLGRSLAEIGHQLENMRIDVDPERSRVEIDTGQGGRFSFKVPEDVQHDIRVGIAKMGVELQRVLADSSRGGLPEEVRVLLDQLPDDLKQNWSSHRKIKRHVVANSVFKSFRDFEVAEDEIIAGDLIVVGGDAYVAGEVRGSTWVVFGDLLVEGQGSVAQDAVSVGGQVVLDEDAEVRGNRFDAAGFLPGIGVGLFGPGHSGQWLIYSIRVGVLGLLLLLGFAVASDRVQRMADHGLQLPARDLASGALWFPVTLGAFVLAAVGLAISVIGIPVVILLSAAFFVVILLAYFVGCQFLGMRFFRLFADEDGRPDWVYALLGLALLEIPPLAALTLSSRTEDVGLLMGLQVADYLLKFLAMALGFGALVATRLGARASLEVEEPPPALPAPSDA